ncbi:protein ImuB [Sphingomonas sp. PvP055]|uniref:Y-family DNA polymerase n=1 Tax=Sphingomonas sp. PvP055 TaxID=3156391 RepID=UPI0033957555
MTAPLAMRRSAAEKLAPAPHRRGAAVVPTGRAAPSPQPTKRPSRYLAVWFPFLSSDRLARAPGADLSSDAPCVFVENHRGETRITAVDPRAQAIGVAPGMTLAKARSIHADLAVHDSASSADQDWIERIADLCERYTPMVALDEADGVTLDITDCAVPFGGEDALIADLESRLAPWSAHLRHAVAHGPDAAQALARFQTMPAASEAAALRRLDIAALRTDDETLAALRDAGVKTIGDLAGQRPAAITARFGSDVGESLERLLGEDDTPLRPRRRLPALVFERRLNAPIGRPREILAMIEQLVTEASTALTACHEGGRRFAVRLFRSDGRVCDLSVALNLPARDPPTLLRLFRERIGARADPLVDPHDPGAGVDLVRLSVPRIEPLAPTELDLDGGAIADRSTAPPADPSPVARRRTVRSGAHDRAEPQQGLLGIPEPTDLPPAALASDLHDAALRPIHLCDPPQRIDVTAPGGEGPPQRFRWQRKLHDVIHFDGPERIETEGPPQEAAPSVREYFRVQDRRGRRFWIFRHAAAEGEARDGHWYLHGLFA